MSSFVRSQYESLKAAGLDMLLLPVSGHGVWAYLKGVWRLRQMVRKEKPDIIHAHYSTCGFVASLACIGMWKRPKILVSILGSFPTRGAKWRRVRWAIQHLWDGALTKSERTRKQLDLELPVIPNGVNLDVFHPMDYEKARKAVGFDANNTSQITNNHKYVIWCSNPSRPEKNYKLAQEAIRQLQITNDKLQISLVPIFNKTPNEVMTYMNAADCLLLTSWSEGSPNVVKEAMACNCPIVTTDVGDVNERLEGLDGCYVAKTERPVVNSATHEQYAKENAECLAQCLGRALDFVKRTEGRKRLLEDGLSIELTAKKIIKLYESI